jgi:pSer/pThr/pTyr-binding forkhead associated (FHA) protein
MPERTAREVKELLEAEREGRPFLVMRDGQQRQRVLALEPERPELVIGRAPASDVCIDWDPTVSATHARLERTGGTWFVHDDGFSRNGSFLGGDRVHGHRPLRDRDRLRFGRTEVLFRDPAPPAAPTVPGSWNALAQSLSPAQRRVLVALCRPYKHRPAFAQPATNQEIADELFLSIEAIKSHLRALYGKCGLDGVPQGEKRVRLVEHALGLGLVSEHEL